MLALSHGSRLTLERLGIWQHLPATPIETIPSPSRAASAAACCKAADYGLPAMGYVVAAGQPAAALDDAPRRRRHPDPGQQPPSPASPPAPTASSSASPGRRHAGGPPGGLRRRQHPGRRRPELVERDYAQHAVISVATPVEGHAHRAWGTLRPQGPLAVLPCGSDCAIVHRQPADADALMALDDDGLPRPPAGPFRRAPALASGRPRARYPLLLRYRPDPVGQRTVWLGNAAQTLHPVAGQGYNLACATCGPCAQVLLRAGGDPGAAPPWPPPPNGASTARAPSASPTAWCASSTPTPAAPLFALDLLPRRRGVASG